MAFWDVVIRVSGGRWGFHSFHWDFRGVIWAWHFSFFRGIGYERRSLRWSRWSIRVYLYDGLIGEDDDRFKLTREESQKRGEDDDI